MPKFVVSLILIVCQLSGAMAQTPHSPEFDVSTIGEVDTREFVTEAEGGGLFAATAEEEMGLRDDPPAELEELKAASLELTEPSLARAENGVEAAENYLYRGAIGVKNPVLRTVQHAVLHLWLAGHHGDVKKLLEEITSRLAKPTDPKLAISISASREPGVFVDWGTKTIVIHLGLLGFARNKDELAGMIAVEMERAVIREKLAKEGRSVNAIKINSVIEATDLSPTQQEYLRADLQALERMILANYNPFALYDVYRNVNRIKVERIEYRLPKYLWRSWKKVSANFEEMAPTMEIRMSAIKAFLAWKQEQQDLHDLVTKKEKFSDGQGIMHARMWVYQITATSKWYKRGRDAFMLWAAWLSLKAGKRALWKMLEKREGSVKDVTAISGEINGAADAETARIAGQLETSVLSVLPEDVRSPVKGIVDGIAGTGKFMMDNITFVILSLEFLSIPMMWTYAVIAGARNAINADPVIRSKLLLLRKSTKALRGLVANADRSGDKVDILLRLHAL
ncbi:MAG: hypothetical protein AAB250_08035, partial [Bdellovibrionota bacterium]